MSNNAQAYVYIMYRYIKISYNVAGKHNQSSITVGVTRHFLTKNSRTQ